MSGATEAKEGVIYSVVVGKRLCSEDGFPVITQITRRHVFSKENSHVILTVIVLVPNFYCQKCLRLVSAMTGNY